MTPQWAYELFDEQPPTILLQKHDIELVPQAVIPVEALRDELELIIGQAHGGAMLGGDDAYKACLAIEVKIRCLLASLGEAK